MVTTSALSKAMNEEIIEVPDDLKGRVIGKKGWYLEHIKETSGADLSVCERGFLIRGSDRQREEAKELIRSKLEGASAKHRTPAKTKRTILSYVPENLKGLIIGKSGENLARISTETGVKLWTKGGYIYMKGSPVAERKAHIRIKGQICNATENRKIVKPIRKVFVDSSNLASGQDFNLMPVSSHPWQGKHYMLELLSENVLEREQDDFLCGSDLEEKVKNPLMPVLERLHDHESINEFELDLWCHFGHAFIGNVDEEDEGEVSIEDVKRKLESGEWKGRFRPGMEDAEVLELEHALSEKAKKSTHDVRHDFYFYTPSARKVKVKTWLVNEEGSEDTMSFLLAPPYPLRGIRKREFYGDPTEEKTSKKPCFFLCSPYQKVLIIDVVAPASQFDCRFVLRASEKHPESLIDTEEEDKALCEYLSDMRIEGDTIILPPASQLPENFQQNYSRRSVRRTYAYPSDAGTFILTVSHETQTEGDILEQQYGVPTKTDVLLHFEDWSTAADLDAFNPINVSSKLSHFIQFVRNVQGIIKYPKR